MLLSNGLADWATLDTAVATVRNVGAPLAIFQCTTAYPCPPERVGLNVIEQLRTRYDCPAGLSDHSGKIYAGLAAVTLGANLLEMHIVLDRDCFCPDVPASLTTTEFKQLVDGVRFIESALGSRIDKDAAAAELAELRRVFGKSVVAARDLAAGQKLEAGDLALKKPGSGIPAADLGKVYGRVLRVAVNKDTLLAESDFVS